MGQFGVVQGSSPSIQEALDLYFMLSKSDTQLRQPVGLEEQLMSDTRLDSIVGMSMLQLLQVIPSSSSAANSEGWCCNPLLTKPVCVSCKVSGMVLRPACNKQGLLLRVQAFSGLFGCCVAEVTFCQERVVHHCYAGRALLFSASPT